MGPQSVQSVPSSHLPAWRSSWQKPSFVTFLPSSMHVSSQRIGGGGGARGGIGGIGGGGGDARRRASRGEIDRPNERPTERPRMDFLPTTFQNVRVVSAYKDSKVTIVGFETNSRGVPCARVVTGQRKKSRSYPHEPIRREKPDAGVDATATRSARDGARRDTSTRASDSRVIYPSFERSPSARA